VFILTVFRDFEFLLVITGSDNFLGFRSKGLMVIDHQTDWSRGNALGLYLVGASFKSRPGPWLSWLRFFYYLPQSMHSCWDSTSIRPQSFPSISSPIHQPSHHPTLYTVHSVLKMLLNTLWKRWPSNEICSWKVSHMWLEKRFMYNIDCCVGMVVCSRWRTFRLHKSMEFLDHLSNLKMLKIILHHWLSSLVS
jgi:hypothetical protein